MVGHVDDGKFKNSKTLLRPFCESTGVTPEQKKAEDKILELMAWKERQKANQGPYRLKTNKNYFLNQDRINSHR